MSSGRATQELLDRLVEGARAAARAGRVADYIPALARARPEAVGAAITSVEGELLESGEARAGFTLQSVSKAIALPYVIDARGEEAVFSRVGKEPTGDPFNSIIRLEASSLKKPYNPMINAGAIVLSSLMPGSTGEERAAGFRGYAAALLGLPSLALDEEVYRSEAATANKNRSIAWFLKELGLVEGEVDEALDGYFRQCATLVDAASLSRCGACLALDGLEPGSAGGSGRRLMSERAARVTKALMCSCGLYDGSGAFCVEAGIPAKSGVGGGILASARGRAGIGSYGPALDPRGNSAAGLSIVEGLSRELGLFAL
ncbi:MAG TPA: glutaminase A [Spirochaetales bacterium]|nr:glutaminase A [Spirochaetales bacterium]HRY55077.1 glutaminase A [Spirochaetia bacterium]HRZ64927.1 glutaminase A [Spirochaetia bacterium]